MIKNKITLIGGDRRQTFLADSFLKYGYEVYLYGDFDNIPKDVTVCESMRQAVNISDIIILPLPLTRDCLYINFGEGSQKKVKISDMFALSDNKLLLAGSIPPIVKDYAQKEGIRLIDYYDDEDVCAGNAYLTAEGAVFGAMSLLEFSLKDARVAVTGFGRIGKELSRLLVNFGADVSVAARKESALSLAKSIGCNTLKIGVDMEKKSTLLPLAKSYDIIFNTVPAWIFDETFFKMLSPKTVMVELASSPGGFDMSVAQKSGARVVSLQGVPGKYAPVSAGRLLFESIEKILKRENVL